MANPVYIDIHTHNPVLIKDTLPVQNVYDKFETVKPSYLYSLGIHPWYIDNEHIEQQFEVLKTQATLDNVIAIGECGLDKMTESDWNMQINVFKMQIELANSIHKPLIIHCVRAYEEVLKMLKDNKVNVPVIFHGFNKNRELAEQILKQGYYLSFGAALLRKDAQISEVLASFSADRFFLETDNSDADIKEIYTAAAAIRKTPLDALILQLQKNFETVFKR